MVMLLVTTNRPPVSQTEPAEFAPFANVADWNMTVPPEILRVPAVGPKTLELPINTSLPDRAPPYTVRLPLPVLPITVATLLTLIELPFVNVTEPSTMKPLPAPTKSGRFVTTSWPPVTQTVPDEPETEPTTSGPVIAAVAVPATVSVPRAVAFVANGTVLARNTPPETVN